MSKPKRIGLSIDFDFFVREDPDWDWGHSEFTQGVNMGDAVWSSRYLSLDLVKACNPKVYADFDPTNIVEELQERGLFIPEGIPLGIADSHLHALEWFKGEKLDLLINLDAHHDSWPIPSAGPDCGSWLTALDVPALSVYPSWGDPTAHPSPERKGVKITKWALFEHLEPNIVVKVFLARSGAWVPPHLDVLFGETASALGDRFEAHELQPIRVRPEPDLRAFAKARKEMNEWLSGKNKMLKPGIAKGPGQPRL